jgi:hypothetical protein
MERRASYTPEEIMGSVRRVLCALRGHEEYMHFDKNRVYLQCVGCGHETPGWTIETHRPTLRLSARPVTKPAGALIRRIA